MPLCQIVLLDLPSISFCLRLPALAELKARLQVEGPGYSSVFMTGSGSTIVCVGSGGCRLPGWGKLGDGVPVWLPASLSSSLRCQHPSCAAPADEPPAFLSEAQYSDLFVSPARLITRQPDGWYTAPSRAASATPAAVV